MENKKIFSEDVIQGITSGNDSQHERISINGLKKILGGREIKNVTRGSGTCGSSGNKNHWSEMCWDPKCGVSRDDAMARQSACGGNWCCDSCGQNGYC